MVVIGLTGGIASGKSVVAQRLAELGAVVLNADEAGHDLFVPHSPVWQEVVDAFGNGILTPDGQIDRRKLGEIVFNDAGARKKLNSIMHSRMYRMMEQRIEDLRHQGATVVILEAALLVEAGWLPLVDQIWVTVAPKAVLIERLRRRNGLTEDQARARIASQLSSEQRVRYADVVIDTNCSLEQLREKVAGLWPGLGLGRNT